MNILKIFLPLKIHDFIKKENLEKYFSIESLDKFPQVYFFLPICGFLLFFASYYLLNIFLLFVFMDLFIYLLYAEQQLISIKNLSIKLFISFILYFNIFGSLFSMIISLFIYKNSSLVINLFIIKFIKLFLIQLAKKITFLSQLFPLISELNFDSKSKSKIKKKKLSYKKKYFF